ncbi:MAG: hypothetical protein ACEPOZ_07160 [Marinifilaceae bacterium]
MASLGERFTEIGRGYEKVTENYERPYILGVDINDKENPFIVASGDHPSDSGAALISIEELFSEQWKEHIQKSNSTEFVNELREAVERGEQFPQNIILDKVNTNPID